jgi:hypothetical protein
MKYLEEIAFLDKVEEKLSKSNKRIRLSIEEIKNIKNKYKNIPDDYLDYLKYVGWGSFRESQFMIYEGLITFSDLGIETGTDEFNDLIFWGDNFAGDLSGFNLRHNVKVIEWWHDSDKIYETGKTFQEYIREQMLMGENGR